MDVGDALVDARLIEVGDDHRHLQAAHEEQRELASHEARADHADLGHRARESLVGSPGRTLGALLHQVEGVDAGAELVTRDEVGQGVILGGEARLPVGVLRGLDELEGLVGGVGDASDAAREGLLRDADGDIPLREPFDLARLVLALDLGLARDHGVCPRDRILEEVGWREDRVGNAEVEGLLGAEHPVVLERVRDDDLEGVLDTDQVGQQPRAAPTRDQSEEHLGQRERRRGAVDRAVVGVEADLHATTEREPVREDERGHAELGELAQRPVPQLGHLLAGFIVRDVVDLREIGPGREDERLARDGDAVDLALLRARRLLVENLGETQQGVRAQRVGPGVVLAVVERDEGEGLAARDRDIAHERVRDDLVRVESRELREAFRGSDCRHDYFFFPV